MNRVQAFETEQLPTLIKNKCKMLKNELISGVKTIDEDSCVNSIISKSDGSVIYSLESGLIKKLDPIKFTTKELCNFKGILYLIISNDEKYICATGNTNSAFVIDEYEFHDKYTGHDKHIKGASFSPDSKLLITASKDKTSIIWNLKSKQLVVQLKHHTQVVNRARINSNSMLALTCSSDKTVILWKIAIPEKPEAQFIGHTSTVNDCIFSLDESVVLSSADDNTIRIWSVERLCLTGTLRGHLDNVGHLFNISATLIASLGDLTIRIWNIQTKLAEAVLFGHTCSPENFVVTSNCFFTSSPDKTIRAWNKHSYAQMAVYKGHTKTIIALTPSRDNKSLYSGGEDQKLKVWNIDDSYLVGTLDFHTDFVIGVAITKDNKWIISGGGDGVILKWDLDNMCKVDEFHGHVGYVFRLAFIKNDREFLSVGQDRSLKLWDFHTKNLLFSKVGHSNNVYIVALPVDESFIITGGFDGKIIKWNFNTDNDDKGNPLMYLNRYDPPIGNKKTRGMILSLVITKDTKTIISVGRDRCIRFWDTETLTETDVIDRKHYYEIAIAISSDDLKFATGSQDCNIRLWNMKERCIIGILEGHIQKIDALVFLNADSNLISGSSDTSIRIWNLEEMSFEAALEGHTDRVRNLCLSHDQFLIISASTDHSLKVWRYFSPVPEPGKINFQGVKDQWKGLFALNYLKAKPESWMKYIYIQPYRVNRLHIYCHQGNHNDLEIALNKGFRLITASDGYHPLSIAIKENSANCVDQILSYLCRLATSSPYVFENIIKKISPIFPQILNYSPTNIRMFLDTLMIESTEDLPTLGIPIETLPKIILKNQYVIDRNEFVKADNVRESGKVPIQFFKSPFVWNLEIGSQSSINLLESIKKCSILQIFETKFIQNLVTYKWNKLWLFIFIQTIIYWTSLVIFALTIFARESRKNLASVLLTLEIIFILYELFDFISNFKNYFKNFFNLVDLTVFSGTSIWSIMIITTEMDPATSEYMYFSWILGIGLSLRGITYFRTFKLTRFYMRMIWQAVIDTYAFILILIYSTLCFAILDYLSMSDHDNLLMASIESSILKSYTMNLSNFNQPDSILGEITFIIQSCINIIIIFNLLISILASSHKTFEGVSAMHNYKEMLEIIIEIEKIMMWKRNLGSNSSIQCCEMLAKIEKRYDIVASIRSFTEKKLRQLEDTEKERHEESMTEFTRLKTDIGNIYAILTNLKLGHNI